MRNHKLVTTLGTILLLAGIAAGTAWAGQAAPASLDQILKAVATFDGGIDSAPFWALRDYVYARRDDPAARAEVEARLLEFLGTPATPIAKMAVCRHLRLIGGEKSVPVLGKMLLSPATSDMALYALAKIPGSTVDAALRAALAKTSGPVQVSLIGTIGLRETREAVPALAPFLANPKSEAAKAAAFALGRIGGPDASAALVKAFAGAPADMKIVLAASLLPCAERSLRDKDLPAAAAIYEKILAANLSPSANLAAMLGKISAAGDQSANVLLEALRGNDPVRQEAAIKKIKDVIGPEAIAPVCGLLPVLPEPARVELLAVLSGYPRDKVLPVILETARADKPGVRLAAMKALATAGGPSAVPFLAERAASTRGAEQTAARAALASLKGRDVDEAILARLAQKPEEAVLSELLQAVSERRVFAAKSVVASYLQASSAALRLQAVKGLRTIGTPSDIPAVLDALLKSGDPAEGVEMETTIAVLAQKIANPDGRANAVKDRLAGEKDPAVRARLFSVLQRVGDDSALPLLRAGLMDPNAGVVDAAVRALAAWPGATPIEDVRRIAGTSTDETLKLLALQGYIRMSTTEKYRRPEAVVADLKNASGLARRPEEKRLVLAALAQFPCADGLDLARALAADAAVKAEADAAIKAIDQKIKGK